MWHWTIASVKTIGDHERARKYVHAAKRVIRDIQMLQSLGLARTNWRWERLDDGVTCFAQAGHINTVRIFADPEGAKDLIFKLARPGHHLQPLDSDGEFLDTRFFEHTNLSAFDDGGANEANYLDWSDGVDTLLRYTGPTSRYWHNHFSSLAPYSTSIVIQRMVSPRSRSGFVSGTEVQGRTASYGLRVLGAGATRDKLYFIGTPSNDTGVFPFLNDVALYEAPLFPEEGDMDEATKLAEMEMENHGTAPWFFSPDGKSAVHLFANVNDVYEWEADPGSASMSKSQIVTIPSASSDGSPNPPNTETYWIKCTALLGGSGSGVSSSKSGGTTCAGNEKYIDWEVSVSGSMSATYNNTAQDGDGNHVLDASYESSVSASGSGAYNETRIYDESLNPDCSVPATASLTNITWDDTFNTTWSGTSYATVAGQEFVLSNFECSTNWARQADDAAATHEWQASVSADVSFHVPMFIEVMPDGEGGYDVVAIHAVIGTASFGFSGGGSREIVPPGISFTATIDQDNNIATSSCSPDSPIFTSCNEDCFWGWDCQDGRSVLENAPGTYGITAQALSFHWIGRFSEEPEQAPAEWFRKSFLQTRWPFDSLSAINRHSPLGNYLSATIIADTVQEFDQSSFDSGVVPMAVDWDGSQKKYLEGSLSFSRRSDFATDTVTTYTAYEDVTPESPGITPDRVTLVTVTTTVTDYQYFGNVNYSINGQPLVGASEINTSSEQSVRTLTQELVWDSPLYVEESRDDDLVTTSTGGNSDGFLSIVALDLRSGLSVWARDGVIEAYGGTVLIDSKDVSWIQGGAVSARTRNQPPYATSKSLIDWDTFYESHIIFEPASIGFSATKNANNASYILHNGSLKPAVGLHGVWEDLAIQDYAMWPIIKSEIPTIIKG